MLAEIEHQVECTLETIIRRRYKTQFFKTLIAVQVNTFQETCRKEYQ